MPFPQSWLSPSRVSAQCRNQSTIAGVLHCWLTENPRVASRLFCLPNTPINPPYDWTQWPASLRHDLAWQVTRFLKWYGDGMPGRFPLSFKTPIPRDAPGDPSYDGGLVMDDTRAKNVYLGHVANNLALEMAGVLPWSITGYSDDDLWRLLNWNDWLQYIDASFTQYPGYYLVTQSSPATPALVVKFLHQHQLLGTDTTDMVARLFTWCRNLTHYFCVAPQTEPDPHQFWGPDAPPIPVSMLLKGTTYTGPPSGPRFGRYTMGCRGTSEFMQSVLRIVNVPVQIREEPSGHVMPYFPTIDRTLSHGDDPYNLLGLVSAFPGWPQPAATEFLITGAQWETWFGAGVDPSEHNVGRRPAELAVQYQSDYLLNYYCQDQVAHASHATGKVFQTLSYFYTLDELEAMQLWDKLAAKAAGTGFCQ